MIDINFFISKKIEDSVGKYTGLINLYTNVFESISKIKFKKFIFMSDYRVNGNFEEPSFPCNDEFGDLEGHTFDTKYCKQPILWKYNGKILNTTDLDDLPF